MKREDQSNLIENILVEAAKKNEKPVNEKEKALEVLKRFKNPKHKLHVKKHIDELEKGHEPKKVLKNFFKDLSKVSSIEEIDKIAGFTDELQKQQVKLETLKKNMSEIEEMIADVEKKLKDLKSIK